MLTSMRNKVAYLLAKTCKIFNTKESQKLIKKFSQYVHDFWRLNWLKNDRKKDKILKEIKRGEVHYDFYFDW